MTDSDRKPFPSWRGFVPLGDRPQRAIAQLQAAQPQLATAIASLPPIELDRRLDAEDPHAGYARVDSASREAVATIARAHGEPVAEAFLLHQLAWLMTQFDERFARSRLDEAFRPQFVDSFHRICDHVTTGRGYRPGIRVDAYLKDLGICRLRILPAVGQLIYPWSGIGRKAVLRQGLAATAYVWGRCGGASPMMELHTHDPMLRYFTAAGWEESYRLAAIACRSFPDSKGLFGSSWWFDPALAAISPGLDFVRDVPAAKGAILVRVGVFEEVTGNALHKNPMRAELHRQGKYQPTAYMMVWSRRDLLRHYG